MPIAFGASLGTATGSSPDNSWNITTTGAVPAGGTVVVGVGWFNSDATLTVTGGGLTWTTQVTKSNSQRNTALVTAPAPAGLAAGSTITVTVAAGSFACGSAAMYVTGADTLDASGVGNAATQAWSASLTSVTADTIIVGFGWVDGLASGSSAPATNYSEWCDFVNGADVNVFSGVYRVVAAAAAYTPGGTWSSGTNPWVAAGIALSGAAPAPPQGDTSGAVTWAGTAAGTNRPAVPANLQAVAVSSSQIDLTWDAVTGVSGYDIERDGVVIVFDHPTTSYSDTGLDPDTQYDYRVRAVE